MPRSRPASNPLSFHKPTGRFYVTRGGRRIYLGADRDLVMEKYHRLALGVEAPEPLADSSGMSAKDLANRFLEAQQANCTAQSCSRDTSVFHRHRCPC